MAKAAKKSSGKNTSSSKTKTTASKKSSATGKRSNSENGQTEGLGQEELMKLFEHALKDIFWVEKALTRAIPKMIKNATSDELIEALEDHLDVTEQQVTKVERVFEAIGKKARAKKCTGMEGIIKEGEEIMEEFEGKGPTLDAAIIMAAQKVEHYEMSSYISMITLAESMKLTQAAQILQDILEEEMEADDVLTNLSVSTINEEILEE